MDELIELNEELEAIRKKPLCKFKEPVAYLGDNGITFNKAASQVVPDRIEWFTSSSYVIGLPSKSMIRGYAVKICQKGYLNRVTAFPSVLRHGKKVKNGYYKLYKYKDGFAFKRYEPLEES